MINQRRIFAVGMVFLIVFQFASLAVADNVVIDDNFSTDQLYSIGYFNKSDLPPDEANPDDTSYAEYVILTSGGNLDDYLELTHLHQVTFDQSFGDPDYDTMVQSFLHNQSVVYNPTTQGAIDSVTFSMDVRTSGPFQSAFFGIRDVNGGNFGGFGSVKTDETWNNYSVTLGQSDFSSRDFAGALDLQFGFGFVTSGIDVSDGPRSFVVDVDNFKVVVSVIPEPGSISVLGLVCLTMTSRRRRTQAVL